MNTLTGEDKMVAEFTIYKTSSISCEASQKHREIDGITLRV